MSATDHRGQAYNIQLNPRDRNKAPDEPAPWMALALPVEIQQQLLYIRALSTPLATHAQYSTSVTATHTYNEAFCLLCNHSSGSEIHDTIFHTLLYCDHLQELHTRLQRQLTQFHENYPRYTKVKHTLTLVEWQSLPDKDLVHILLGNPLPKSNACPQLRNITEWQTRLLTITTPIIRALLRQKQQLTAQLP